MNYKVYQAYKNMLEKSNQKEKPENQQPKVYSKVIKRIPKPKK